MLGVIHLVGAVLLYLLASTPEFASSIRICCCYMMLYMPTLALVNAIAFRQIDDPALQFGTSVCGARSAGSSPAW